MARKKLNEGEQAQEDAIREAQEQPFGVHVMNDEPAGNLSFEECMRHIRETSGEAEAEVPAAQAPRVIPITDPMKGFPSARVGDVAVGDLPAADENGVAAAPNTTHDEVVEQARLRAVAEGAVDTGGGELKPWHKKAAADKAAAAAAGA